MKLHPDDLLNLFGVRSDLKIRYLLLKALGVTAKDMHAEGNRAHGYIAKMLDNTAAPWDWHWTTLDSLCEATSMRPRVDITGIDLEYAPMHLIGLEKSAFLGVGVMETLDVTRRAAKLSGVELAQRMGVSHKSVGKLAQSDNPALSTMYRQTRAMGGVLTLSVEEKK